jgi:hypothetical protein
MALDLINRSLEKGYGPGYRVLGEMYEEGLGVEQDLAMAIEMYKRAAEAGYEVAEKELERLLPSHRDSGGPR